MNNELIYPIYLDIPMMTSFLASIDNGIIDEAEVETKTTDIEKKSKKGKLQAGISGIVGMIKASAEGEISKEVSQNLESNYKTNVKYPQAWLFNRLRALLEDSNLIKSFDEKDSLKEINVGDIVEFEGMVEPDPSFILRSTFNQLLPIAEPYFKIEINKLQTLLKMIKDVKKNNNIELDGGEKITLGNKNTWIREFEHKISNLESNISLINLMKESINSLFPEKTSLHNLVVKTSKNKIICKIYKDYARNETINDIHYGSWRILGKVISKINNKNPYDLMKDSPFSFLPKTQFNEMIASINNETLKLPDMSGKIEEESLLIAPIGIFI